MKGGARFWFCHLVLVILLLDACSDSREVNASFNRTRVTWSFFAQDQADGLRPLPGFEQAVKVVWLPRPLAVVATDLGVFPGIGAAVAVSHLGLLVLDDSTGTLTALRPGAQWSMSPYQTDLLFSWKGKLFLTLRQESPAEAPPASLAWWTPGQNRLVFYPIPSQVQDPSRQAVAFSAPTPNSVSVGFVWKLREGTAWSFERTSLALDTGTEGSALAQPPEGEKPLDRAFDGLKARLAERLGSEVPVRAALGSGPLLLFTESGWVAVGQSVEGRARLYRLPELGMGRYTSAAALTRGWVFTWETSYRGYVGAAGLVHVPFAVLAP